MTDSRLQTTLLAILCLLVAVVVLRDNPVAQAGPLDPTTASSDAIAERLDLILAELRADSPGPDRLRSKSSEPARKRVDAGELAPILASLDRRIADLTTHVRLQPLSRRLTPKPTSRTPHHQPWMEFKRSLRGGRISDRVSATFNFMSAEDVLATFGPPSYINSGGNGPLWIYKREGSKSSDDDYAFYLRFHDGYVIRVLN